MIITINLDLIYLSLAKVVWVISDLQNKSADNWQIGKCSGCYGNCCIQNWKLRICVTTIDIDVRYLFTCKIIMSNLYIHIYWSAPIRSIIYICKSVHVVVAMATVLLKVENWDFVWCDNWFWSICLSTPKMTNRISNHGNIHIYLSANICTNTFANW